MLLPTLLPLALTLLPTLSWGKTLKVDVTAKSTLNCGNGDHGVTSGYVHLAQGSMFFSLFEGTGAAKNAGLVIQFEGGPGASAFDYPFIGAGPCQLTPGGNVTLSPAPHPWTDHANLLVVDFPLATGWSYNTTNQVPANTSALASEDFDDFLQAFYKSYPQYVPQPLIISTLSYGGTTGSHIASTILKRNNEAGWFSTRVVKKIDQLLYGNAFADAMADIYGGWDILCNQEPVAYNASTCAHWRDNLTTCLDRLRYLNDIESTPALRVKALTPCVQSTYLRWEAPLYNRYDRTAPRCYPADTCFWWRAPLLTFMNLPSTRQLLGAPANVTWYYLGYSSVYFSSTGDNMQSAFKLLEPVLKAGTRLLAYSGLDDTMVPYPGTYSWMSRLPNPQLANFRASNVTTLPAGSIINGTIVNAGTGYSLVGVEGAGHIVEQFQPQLTQAFVKAAVAGKNWNPL
ncbi:hypothetical protein IAT38_001527 [Cryptococcus sp. DSM 104549]